VLVVRSVAVWELAALPASTEYSLFSQIFDVNRVNDFGAILLDAGIDGACLEARQFFQLFLE
jgi:hypothetical protein